MLLSRFVRKASLCGLGVVLAVPGIVWGQATVIPQALEYPIAGSLPGDQIHPQLALSASGGFLVWEDNITDGYGQGLSAQRLDSSYSPALAPFRVNVTAAGDQERPRVALLSGGGAAFVWQGGPRSAEHIYARFLSSSNLWLSTNDVAGQQQQHRLAARPSARGPGQQQCRGGLWQPESGRCGQHAGCVCSNPLAHRPEVGSEFLANQFTTYESTYAVRGLV